MLQSKLTQLLSSLSVDEFRRFKKVLQSPFFTTNTHHLKLYNIFKKYYPTFDHHHLKKEHIFSKLFPKKKYDDNKIRMLIRDFTKLLEDYFFWLDIRSNKYDYDKRLLFIYIKRGLFQWYERDRQQLLKTLNAQPYRDLEYYNELYALDFAYFFHPLTPKHKLQDKILIRLMDSVDKQFALAKYRIYSEMKNRSQLLNKDYKVRFFKTIEQERCNGFLKKNAFFEHFSLLLHLYQPSNQEITFQQLKLLFTTEVKELRRVDQSLFLTQLINFAVRQINNGKATYYKEALDLYKVGLANHLIMEHDQMTDAAFGNIVTVGCHAKDFEWTRQFIDDYMPFLEQKNHKNTVAINLGIWHFYQKNFNQAYDLFLENAFIASYPLMARFYLIRALFEKFLVDKSLFDFLIMQIESFEKLLYRNHITRAYHQKAFLNSTQVLKKITLGIIRRKNINVLQKTTLQQINKKEKMIAKNWLIQKILGMK